MRKARYIKQIIILSIYLLLVIPVFAQSGEHKAIPDLPSTPRLVNDFADMLSPDEEALLETKLLKFENESSNEVTIVTVSNLDEMEVSAYALELGRKWNIGKEKKKNGVLLLASKDDRKVNISPGYGLSGVLPDITCGRIIRQYMVPDFKSQQYYQGFDKATTAIIAASKGEFTNDEPNATASKKGFTLFKLIFIIIALMIYFFFRRNSGNMYVSRRGYGSMGGAWLGGGLLGGGFGGGGDDNNSSGFGGFGGGGGGFDGGGASGSW